MVSVTMPCETETMLTLSDSWLTTQASSSVRGFTETGSMPTGISTISAGLDGFEMSKTDTRVSVFDISNPSSPALIVEIPVGIEPVSVNPRTDDEAWVVNQESDSVSIVSVSQGIVTDTIYVKDEPSDVVFAGNNLAFVSVARSDVVCRSYRLRLGRHRDGYHLCERRTFRRRVRREQPGVCQRRAQQS